MEWWQDPKLWIMAVGVTAQYAVNSWRTAQHDRRITILERDVDSLREWRAQAREQMRQVQQHLRESARDRE